MELKKLCLLFIAAVPVCEAAYDADDTVKLSAELAYRYDDNVFRLADDANNSVTLKNGTQGDSYLQATVAGRIDIPVSRQKFYASANVSRQQYFSFDELDYTAWQTELGWQWQAGNQFSGSLAAHASESMNSFDDVRTGIVDMIRENGANWTGYWQLMSNWLLLADASYAEQKHSERHFDDARVVNYGLGVRYVTDKGSSITLRQGWQTYDYLNDLQFFPADLRGYDEQLTSLALSWPFSAQLQFNATAGLSRWTAKSGLGDTTTTPQGDIGVVWQPSEKTRVRAGYGQNFNQFSSGIGRDLERKFYLGANWAQSAKMAWDTEVSHRQRTSDTSVGVRVRDELYDTVSLALNYAPTRSITIRPYVRLEWREDQLGKADYSDSQVGISAKYNY
jgi:hypothetical protein